MTWTTGFWKRCLVAAAIVSLVVVGGCGPKAGRVEKQQTPTVKVGYMPIAECLPLFVAVEQGYFDQVGLKVELVQFPGGAPTLEALGAGSIDLAFSNLVSLIFARVGGRDFVAVWGATMENETHKIHGLVVRKDSSLRKLADLRGKTIAVNTLKNIDELLLLEALGKYGVRSTEVKLLEVPFPRMSTVLQNEDVDAIGVVEPFLTVSTTEQSGRVISDYFVDALGGNVYITSFCASQAWAGRHDVAVSRFRSAMRMAVEYCREHEDAARQTLPRYTRLSAPLAKRIVLPVFSPDLPPPAAIQNLVQRMVKRQWIREPVRAAEILHGEAP